MRLRRRAERGHIRHRPGQGQTRRFNEQSKQRLLIWGAVIVTAVIFIMLTTAWVMTSYLPARATVAVVDGERIQARDIVPYTQLDGIQFQSYNPNRALNNYIRDIILRNRAANFGIAVSAQDIDRRIAEQFDPAYDEDDPPDALSQAAQQNLQRYLSLIEVSERDFRAWTEGMLLRDAFADRFQSEVPQPAESAYVHWIVAQDAERAQEAYDRIEAGEEFAAVAQELNLDDFLADENGEVGWIPRGVWDDLDPYLFGEEVEEAEGGEGEAEEGETPEPIEVRHGEAVGPLSLSIGNVVLLVTDGPSEQPIREEILEILGFRAFQDWLDERVTEMVEEMNITNDNFTWIVGQLS